MIQNLYIHIYYSPPHEADDLSLESKDLIVKENKMEKGKKS